MKATAVLESLAGASAGGAVRMLDGVVTLVEEGGKVAVQCGSSACVAQRTAAVPRVAVGERVVVLTAGPNAFLIASLETHDGREEVRLGDGTSARREVIDGAEKLKIINPAGQCLFEYDSDSRRATLSVAQGDLALRAERGAVSLFGSHGVRIESDAEVSLRSRHVVSVTHSADDAASVRVDGRGVTVEGPTVRVLTKRAEAVLDEVKSTVRAVDTKVERMRQQVGVLETSAGRIVERAKSVFRDVEGLAQSRVGRLRVLARDAIQFSGRRTTVVAQEEVKLDGKKILLG